MRKFARLTLSCPPPSVNAMYNPIGHGKSILSKEGRAWKRLAAAELMGQKGIIDDPMYWRMDVLIGGNGARCDLPNYEKALTDILVSANKVPDDRYLVDYRLRFYHGRNVRIAVKIEELEKWSIIRNASKSLIRKLGKSLD